MPVTHSTVVVVPDDGTSPVGTDEWNANHVVTTVTATLEDSVNNAVTTMLTLTHTTSGTPANGIGTGIDFVAETSAGNNEIGAQIQAVVTDVTTDSEDFAIVFKTMAGGAAAGENFRFTGVAAAGSATIGLANSQNTIRSEGYVLKTASAGVDVCGFYPDPGFGIIISSAYPVGWAPSTNVGAQIDTGLYRDAAGVIAQRLGTNAQTFRVYNTYTDASNCERGVFDWITTTNVLTIGTESLGTGTARPVHLKSTATLDGLVVNGVMIGGVTGDRGQMLLGHDGNDPLITNNNTYGVHFTIQKRGNTTGYLNLLSNNGIILGGTASGVVVNTANADSYISDHTNTSRKGLGLESYSEDLYITKRGRNVQDEATKDLWITGAAAWGSASTNLTGGNLRLHAGYGASGSAGAAHGGHVYLDGGRGYGTGAHGSIIVGASYGNLRSQNYIDIVEITAPANPAANYARVYSKDDGGVTKLYFRDSAGTETQLGAAGAPSNLDSLSDVTITSPQNGEVLGYNGSAWVNTAAGGVSAPLTLTLDDATTNAVSTVLTAAHTTTGTPANGIGVGINFTVETTTGNNEIGAQIQAVVTDVTATSEDFDLVFKTMTAGAAASERLRISANGSGTSLSATDNLIITISGIQQFRVDNGGWYAGGGYLTSNSAILAFGASSDVVLQRDGAADILGQRRSTNAQTFRLYNTYTDASNWERAALTWSGNVCTLKTEKAGTGTNRELNLVSADNMRISASSYVIFQTGAPSETARITLASGAYECGLSGSIGFGSGAAGTTDTALSRNAAGVVEVNNGSAGTFRDIRVRNAIDDNGTIYSNIPQNSQSAAYTLVLADANKHVLHPSADTTARTFTIPANASVAFPIGTAVTFVNQNAAGTVTIAITTDTLRLAGAGTTGSRTLAANGIATAIKLTATEWIISGTGLT